MNTTTKHTRHHDECCKHKETEEVCDVMEKCCSHMSPDDKKEMMSEMMPKMMDITGSKMPGNMMGAMMKHCMKAMRWMPLIPLTVGVVLFSLGYFLSPDVIRALWLIVSGLIIFVAVAGLIMASAMAHTHKEIHA